MMRRTRVHALRSERHVESLEARQPLAADFHFAASPWTNTFGHADVITAVGDLDGDHIDDFVARGADAAASPNAWYRLDLQTNELKLAGSLPSISGPWLYIPEVAVDMDQDGDRDLVMSARNQSNPDSWTKYEWIENSDGRGTFTTLHSISSALHLSAHVADLDRDGDFDLSYWSFFPGADTLTVGWSENTAGQIEFHELYSGPGNIRYDGLYDPDNDGVREIPRFAPSLRGIVSADLNGDNVLEEIRPNGLWRPNSDLPLGTLRALPGATETSIARPDDIDGDGDTDVWLQNGTELRWLRNDGTGNFDSLVVSPSLRGDIVLAQLDTDAAMELATLDPLTHRFTWHDFNAVTQQLTPHAGQAPALERAQAAADLNGDGRADLVTLRGWYEATAQPNQFVFHDYPEALDPHGVEPADIDGDGRLDLISYVKTSGFNPIRRVQWSRQQADGSFSDPVLIANIPASTIFPLWDTRAVDIDRDGDADLLTLSQSDWPLTTVRWYENQGGADPFTLRDTLVRMEGIASLDQLVDLDGDQDLDLVLRAPELSWAERTSDGTYVPRERIDRILASTVLAADLDRDGDADLVAADNGRVAWYENTDGKGLFSPANIIAVVENVFMLQVNDLNADGDVDLLIGQRAYTAPESLERPTWTYRFFHNVDGEGNWEPSAFVLSNRGELALVADLTGDGRAELIETPTEGSGIIFHQNTTSSVIPPGDINRDGDTDLLDIDELCRAIAAAQQNARFDLTGDGQVNVDDHRQLVRDLLKIPYGDANGDGNFNSSDLVQAFAGGGYEIERTSGWREGDWNCDGRFNSSDLVLAMQESNYEATQVDASVLVYDDTTHRILRYRESTGDYLGQFAQVRNVSQMLVTPSNELLTISEMTLRRLRSDGTQIDSIRLPSLSPTMSIGPSGQVYLLDFDGTVRSLNFANNQMSLGNPMFNLSGIYFMQFGPDGKLYGSPDGQTLNRYDATTGQLEGAAFKVDSGFFTYMIGKDGAVYVMASESGVPKQRIEKRDLATGTLQKVLVDELERSEAMQVTNDGHLLIKVSNGVLRKFDAQTGALIETLVQPGQNGLKSLGLIVYWPG